jgi:PTS system nitrogen regulatory IIA component
VKLLDLLAPDRITARLRAGRKVEAVREIAALFAGVVDDVDRVADVFMAREAIASTGVGDGVAIPHGDLDDVDAIHAALAICPEGVDFDSIDGQPVFIFVALVGPTTARGQHLKALARVGRLLKREEVRERLVEAEDEEALLAVLESEEGPA